jgi:hypothetical protein
LDLARIVAAFKQAGIKERSSQVLAMLKAWIRELKREDVRHKLKREDVRHKLKREDGSISVLVFGLFAVVLLASVVLTDISAIIVAKRSLIQATESAAQSAAHALDLETYYQGKHSALSFLVTDASPVIPIDCAAANTRAAETLSNIASTAAPMSSLTRSNRSALYTSSRSDNSLFNTSSRSNSSALNTSSRSDNSLFNTSSNSNVLAKGKLIRPELSDLRISQFQCNGTEVLITTTAKARLPIALSLFSFESVSLTASAGTTSLKKRIFSPFGIL